MIDFIASIFKFLMGMIGFAVFIIVIGFIARAYYALRMRSTSSVEQFSN